ncbi:MAG: DNA topoisomerase 4 subunit A, partial [SAR324 cluster bacterium]|nr:DNA topoisomerase 4 subunit A [SAR324 cluster bacterium]
MNTEGQLAVNIEDEMRQSYMDYAMSVIVGRALPDIRDGLKPVQRRILYAMFREGLTSGKKHSKCAGVVGEVLKRYHPHGDSAVYEALVRLAQDWNLRYPLVDGQGNFGSIDGDPPAAYRYTESRMTELAEKLLADIDKDSVDFIPNFDETTEEPIVLPTLLPNLLINGADGIAVGMATHIPPHNLAEVIDGLIDLIQNPSITLPDLMKRIPGPDFPTGGIILGSDAIVTAYREGKGVIQLRAKASIETLKSGSRQVEAIVITEIPYQVNKSLLLERIAEMVNEREIEGISRIRDESDRNGMRIVLETKRDATPEIVLNQLYKGTPLQSSFGIINLSIVDGKPAICSLIDTLTHFIDFRRDVVTRRTQFELKKARERLHILEGYTIALSNLDEVIQLIRQSQNPPEAKEELINRFKLSDKQAQAILDLRLQKLTSMERLSIEREYEEITKEVARLIAILADVRKVDEIIVSELKEIRTNYADKRRTEIVHHSSDIAVEDLIEDEEMIVSVSHGGYIKRTKSTEFRAQ